MDPISSPLSGGQQQRLGQLLAELRPNQVHWLAGYLAGYCVSAPVTVSQSAEQPKPPDSGVGRLTILFGSQTGNAEGVAERMAA